MSIYVCLNFAAKAYDLVSNIGWFLGMLFSVLFIIGFLIFLVLLYRSGFRFSYTPDGGAAAGGRNIEPYSGSYDSKPSLYYYHLTPTYSPYMLLCLICTRHARGCLQVETYKLMKDFIAEDQNLKHISFFFNTYLLTLMELDVENFETLIPKVFFFWLFAAMYHNNHPAKFNISKICRDKFRSGKCHIQRISNVFLWLSL